MNKDHGLLVERYRPTDLNKYVGNESIKKTFKKFIDGNDCQNVILHGPAGTGKTTLAKLLVKNIDCDYLYINASDERGVDTIRDKVIGFASVASFKPLKIIILDEADYLTHTAQATLRNVIEKFSRQTRFIMTCNYLEMLSGPMQSRCHPIKVVPPSKIEVAKHLDWVMSEESIKHTKEDVKTIVNDHYPDIRKSLEAIQMYNIDGVLELGNYSITESYYPSILEELCKPKPSFKEIRQIIANSGVNDFVGLFRFLYDNSHKYASGKEGMVAYYINEASYQANFRVDKEINAMALINQLLTLSS
jgi:DNA polymerase III delta prime subunit